ncbi:hypothetical protein OKW34_004162 [Paraburkholderia youngii]|uniref:hypothetical protein n=1 Tax=Paraburkholderia youngii TaxID=2782701 RepID=UPI003D19657E
MSYLKSSIGLKSYDWSSVDLLKSLTPESISGSRDIIKSRQEYFWHDMGSEFDSKHFLIYLMNRSDLQLSDDFLEFVCLWHLDEQNHYRGLRKINSVLYGFREDDIDKEIKSRRPEFEAVSSFMVDEFTILASIAFDEITSTRAYKQDFKLFDNLGPDCLSVWIRNATKDEAAHYDNAMKLLKKNHSSRFDELPAILGKIVGFETSDGFRYNNTFIFDHDTDDFSNELLNDSKNTILEAFGREK